MGITAGYHFYLLPEQTHDFMKLLVGACSSTHGTLRWVWPDGREILHLQKGVSLENARRAVPFEDVWRVHWWMSILLPEDEELRSYTSAPAPTWWDRFRYRKLKPKFHEVSFELAVVNSPIRLYWETGHPEYVRIEFNANFKSDASLFYTSAVRNFVLWLAQESKAQAVVFESDANWSFLLDGRSIRNLFAEVDSPERQREFLPAFSHRPGVGAAVSSDPAERAAYLASQLKTGEWGNSLSFAELRPWMEDEALSVRRLAVWALRLGPVQSRDLLPLLQDPLPGIRQLVCEALDNLEYEDRDHEEAAYALLHDPDPGVRIMAGRACLDTRYWSNVEGILLRDPHPQVQLAGDWLHAGRP